MALDAVDLDEHVAEEEATREANQASALLRECLSGLGRFRGRGRRGQRSAGRGLGRGRGRGGRRAQGRNGFEAEAEEAAAEEIEVVDVHRFDCEAEQFDASLAEHDAA